MSVLVLPEDLLLLVLREWLVDTSGCSDLKLLSALDVAVCDRPLLRKLFSNVPSSRWRAEYWIDDVIISERTLMLEWAEALGVRICQFPLLSADIRVIVANPTLPLLNLSGIVLGSGAGNEDDHSLLSMFPTVLDKLPHLTGLIINGSPVFFSALLDATLPLRGPQLVSLEISQHKCDDALLRAIGVSCLELQELHVRCGPSSSQVALLDLLRLRGGSLRRCFIDDRDSSARAWKDEAVLRQALAALSHPALLNVCLETKDDALSTDVFLEFLSAHPRLQGCVVGRHSFKWRGRGAALTLQRLDSRSLDRAIGAMADMPLRLESLDLRLVDPTGTAWLEDAVALRAFSAAHGRHLTTLELYFRAREHVLPFPVLRLAGLLPALRTLRVEFHFEHCMDEQGLLDCFAAEGVTGIGSLVLKDIAGLTDAVLEDVLLAVPTLRSLLLWGCAAVTDEGVATLAVYCPRIETLRVVEMPQISVRTLREFETSGTPQQRKVVTR